MATRSISTAALVWDDLSIFLAIARHGGLSTAARVIGSSPPTLSRRMLALERTLGQELFVRRTHGYDLTEAGARLRDELLEAEAAILRATQLSRDGGLPLVKIAAGTWTALALAGRMPRILGNPPDLRVRLLPGEDILSIARREAAIGLRSRRPTENGLAGRRLRNVGFAIYAVRGAPDRWILVNAATPSARWVAERYGDQIAAETDTPRFALDMALTGIGQVVLPTFIGDISGLERVGSEIEELAHEQWLVTHDADRTLPEVRRALDRIVGIMG